MISPSSLLLRKNVVWLVPLLRPERHFSKPPFTNIHTISIYWNELINNDLLTFWNGNRNLKRQSWLTLTGNVTETETETQIETGPY